MQSESEREENPQGGEERQRVRVAERARKPEARLRISGQHLVRLSGRCKQPDGQCVRTDRRDRDGKRRENALHVRSAADKEQCRGRREVEEHALSLLDGLCDV